MNSQEFQIVLERWRSNNAASKIISVVPFIDTNDRGVLLTPTLPNKFYYGKLISDNFDGEVQIITSDFGKDGNNRRDPSTVNLIHQPTVAGDSVSSLNVNCHFFWLVASEYYFIGYRIDCGNAGDLIVKSNAVTMNVVGIQSGLDDYAVAFPVNDTQSSGNWVKSNSGLWSLITLIDSTVDFDYVVTIDGNEEHRSSHPSNGGIAQPYTATNLPNPSDGDVIEVIAEPT